MDELLVDPIGLAWLAKTYQITPIVRMPVQSQIGGRRLTEVIDGYRIETYQESMRPADTPAAHLQFHLRHEVLHLECLSRIFERIGGKFIQAWVDAEPTGQYARRAAFLYELLSNDTLQLPKRVGGNYVDLLDSTKLVVASSASVIKSSRWRINDNLPGTRYFCPMIVKTDALIQAMELDVTALFQSLEAEFGEELLSRAAVWMTLRESKASFAIEGEEERTTRIERFADMMSRRTGQGDLPLSHKMLAQLQADVLGENTVVTNFGVRQSPVFIGESVRYQDIVYYVAPPADEVANMLDGLRVFFERTKGQSSVMRCAVIAFAFVYIHPLADGNGRIHRFLINDILRRDGVISDPVILPISAVISDDAGERRNYDNVLDEISKPLMREISEDISFTSTYTTYPDGIVSNFQFSGNNKARPVWRYPDMTSHVLYLSNIIRRTLTEQMREQSQYLRNHLRARTALKEIVEMPDQQADRVLRSIEQTQGELSNVLAKQMPVLREPGIWEAIVEAVRQAFREEPR